MASEIAGYVTSPLERFMDGLDKGWQTALDRSKEANELKIQQQNFEMAEEARRQLTDQRARAEAAEGDRIANLPRGQDDGTGGGGGGGDGTPGGPGNAYGIPGASMNYFGNSGAKPGENLTTVKDAYGHTITVNAAAAHDFVGFLNDLQKAGYKVNSVGGFNDRDKAGGSGKSEHAYGGSIDVNPESNPFKSDKTDMPADVAQIAANHGLIWGGMWKDPKDNMHFQWAGPQASQLAADRRSRGEVLPLASLGWGAKPVQTAAATPAPAAAPAPASAPAPVNVPEVPDYNTALKAPLSSPSTPSAAIGKSASLFDGPHLAAVQTGANAAASAIGRPVQVAAMAPNPTNPWGPSQPVAIGGVPQQQTTPWQQLVPPDQSLFG